MRRYAIIVAGGIGTRMRSEIPKQFLKFAGKPILVHTIEKFLQSGNLVRIILVLPKGHLNKWNCIRNEYLKDAPIQIVLGGETRTKSVMCGLNQLKEECLVAIHDAVRPFVDQRVIEDSFESARRYGNGIASVPLKDSIREIISGKHSIVREPNQLLADTNPPNFPGHLKLKKPTNKPTISPFLMMPLFMRMQVISPD